MPIRRTWLDKKLFSAPIHMKRIDHLFICTQTFFRRLFCFVLFRFLTYVENIGLSRTAVCTFYVCLFAFMIRGYSHVRLGGDALYSTPNNCHSKTDEESGTTSIPAPFSWECAPPPRVFYVVTMYTNQIEATMPRVHFTNEKAGYNSLTGQG